jgi:hypothetical protein
MQLDRYDRTYWLDYFCASISFFETVHTTGCAEHSKQFEESKKLNLLRKDILLADNLRQLQWNHDVILTQ